MRDIKFRCWDKVSKSFYLPDEDELYITLVGTPCSTVKNDDGTETIDSSSYRLVLQQFTGLKDKNRVEIYERDVERKS